MIVAVIVLSEEGELLMCLEPVALAASRCVSEVQSMGTKIEQID